MYHSFLQKVVMTILAGACAAGMLMFYRNIVEQSRYEMNEGWKDMFKATPAPRR